MQPQSNLNHLPACLIISPEWFALGATAQRYGGHALRSRRDEGGLAAKRAEPNQDAVPVYHGQTLAKVPIFSGLAEDERAFLTQRTVPRHYAAGEIVFSEGEPCLGLYVVESAHVRIFKSSSGGREHVLSVDGPGSSVAELPVFDGGNYPASAAAIDDATLLFVSKQDFYALCLTHPQVALKVLRVVGARLRRLVGIIEELSFSTVRHRLASFRLRLAQKRRYSHARRRRYHASEQQPRY